MRVLVVPSQYPEPNDPIGGVFVRDYAQVVVARHEVRVAAASAFPWTKPRMNALHRTTVEREGLIQVARISMARPVASALKALWYVWFFKAATQIIRKLWSDWRPDLIHAHTAFPGGVLAMRLAKSWNVPFVLTEHTGPFSKQMQSLLKARLVRSVFRTAACVTAVSNYQRSSIEAHGIRSSFYSVPNPVNTQIFFPTGETADEDRLVFVGLLHPGKGVDLLLKALSLSVNSRWRLDIIGDGTHRIQFQDLSAQLGLQDRVNFLGAQSKEALPRFIRRAAALILPSLQETFGIVLIEALACGRPVITTHCGGPQEFITKSVGIVVQPGSAEELSKALAEFSARRHEFVPQHCAEYAQARFSYQAVGEQLERVYQNAVQGDLKGRNINV